MELIPIILVGGTGSRLWPLSRHSHPKPFLSFSGSPTLFERTVQRALLFQPKKLIVVGSVSHRFLIEDSLKKVSRAAPPTSLLLEPLPKNTAPAVGLAALQAMENRQDALLLILPADHLIPDENSFKTAIEGSLKAAENDYFVLYGIKPLRPETGYGYINIDNPCIKEPKPVSAFVEKPSLEKASILVASGSHFWNSGILCVKASRYLEALKEFQPELYSTLLQVWKQRKEEAEVSLFDEKLFASLPSDSLDYAILEKRPPTVCQAVTFSWDDLGTWNNIALNEDAPQHPNTVTQESRDCHVYSDKPGKMIALLGVKNLTVIDTKDALLVVDKDNAQNVKQLTETLQTKHPSVLQQHPTKHHSWGSAHQMEHKPGWHIEELSIKAGKSLSLNSTPSETTHWVVLSGAAGVATSSGQALLSKGASTTIPPSSEYTLSNDSEEELKLLKTLIHA
jgi:mannose-1-phosphate guanylyltransferase/mannose-6-phosphate isomerase